MKKYRILIPILMLTLIMGLVGCKTKSKTNWADTMETVLENTELIYYADGDSSKSIKNDINLVNEVQGYQIHWEFDPKVILETGKLLEVDEKTRVIATASIDVEGAIVYRQFELFVEKNKSSGTTQNTISIEYVLNGGNNHPNNPSSLEKGSVLSLENPTKEGYEFMGWYSDNRYTELVEDDVVLYDNITLYASWKKIEKPDDPTPDDPVDPITDNQAVIDNQKDPKVVSYYSSINFNEAASSLKADLSRLIYAKELGYDAAKKYLTDSDRDIDNPNKLRGIYDGELFEPHWDEAATWNREHVWPQSKLGGAGKGEAHNLRVSGTRINSSRGNSPFGEPSGTLPKWGQSAGSYWWPGHADKGDVARILMYMYVRHGLRVPTLSQIDKLLSWHNDDPVDKFEIQRNNVIYGVQGNRNPFIDHPEIFEKLWNLARGRTAQAILENQKYEITILAYEQAKVTYVDVANKEYII